MSHSLSRSVALAFFLSLALALPTAALAETAQTADLSGVVLDASGKPAKGYPMKITTQQWGDVIMHPSEDDGTFAVSGLPPGNYELRVFAPGTTENPIASKKVTLAAGQAEKLEIRVGAVATAGTMLNTTGVDWIVVLVGALVVGAILVSLFVMRSQRRPA